MKVYLIRHADAISFETDVVQSDEFRFLTPEGRLTANTVFHGLKDELRDLRLIYSSPLIRAVQTAEILASRLVFPSEAEINVELKNELSTDTTIAKIIGLLENTGHDEVCCVGHEPTMGKLMFHLTGQNITNTGFKKAAVCKINFDVENVKGELEWYFDPDEMNFIYEF
ncbi:MAG TPA: histidine phosphatase family protein [Ignavibacteria bacterium]|nr:histidine phosphatase family protein [Ignavibacteria bacterium]